MANLDQYRAFIQTLLTEKANRGSDQEVEAQTLFDQTQDHYQLIYIGWHNKRHVFGPVLHLDIKDNKIWIQWNGTEDDIAAELVALGVPTQDIVLGFQPPFMRQFTDYAAG
ncbi:XisI protein [Leptolyngbya sp. FACHB-711]|uniref:XisI protein n=1 Tax=unclassified Leptolyngbya TaxID=2650499 RepID=UPI00168294D1|nr:XisI protein [Leptolyngbya sp. FACHB-711]MBD1853636.1 XisI protein [Cyanobacteria bacterium FACHB-502]MBD2028157.1 XisI protein [Leptolyngbya sp. FACHB-711]